MRFERRSVRWTALAVVGLLTFLHGACGREVVEPAPPVPAAPVRIDFGDPAEHHRLTRGWSQPEQADDGSSWVWATETEARVELELGSTVYDQLTVAGWPLAYAGSPRQRLSLAINGHELTEVDMQRRPQTVTLSIPDGALVEGRNLFDFSFAFADSPARLGVGGDERTLAAAFDELTLTHRQVSEGAEEVAATEPSEIRHVLLISVDTLRADRLGCYGYDRETSPEIDALAARGVRFSQAISPSPWTTPAHMSLMTSLAPSAHRVNQSWGDFAESRAESSADGGSSYRILPDEVVTLAEVLRDHGWHTLALTGGTTMAGDIGFAQGFDEYREATPRLTEDHWQVLEGWLSEAGERPFFLFFHTFEVHAPYSGLDFVESMMSAADRRALEELLADEDAYLIPAQREFLKERGLFRQEITSALYDGGIRAADAFLGRLFAELRRLGLDDETLIVVTSDHGEEFGEHHPERIFDAHCTTVYEELLRVPLILHGPSIPESGQEISHPVELLDVAPTILDLVGLPIPPEMQGRSLKGVLDGEAPSIAAWPVSEATCSGPERKALRAGRYKYVSAWESADGERTGLRGELLWEQLFDLRHDPVEQSELTSDPALLALMRRRLGDHFENLPAPFAGDEATLEVSREQEERLRALGYLD